MKNKIINNIITTIEVIWGISTILYLFIIGIPTSIVIIVCVVFPIILGFLISKLIYKTQIKHRNLKIVMETYNCFEELVRDIDKEYSPAVISYLVDAKIEPIKDILATILNLHVKKVISIEKKESTYVFLIKKNANINKLTEDEKYIFLSLFKNEICFNEIEWRKIIKENFKVLSYTKEIAIQKLKWLLKIISAILVGILFIPMVFPIFNLSSKSIPIEYLKISTLFICYIVTFWISLVCIKSYYYTEFMFLNKNGKLEFKKWIKYKKFMKKYTLIGKRKIEDIMIYEEYMPYSVVLGVNKEYDIPEIQRMIQLMINNNNDLFLEPEESKSIII